MLINSKHNDYYDGLSKQYLDKTIVYDREEITLQTNKIDNRSSLYSLLNYYKTLHRHGHIRSNDITPILIGFCGELFILYSNDRKILTTEEEILNFFNEIETNKNDRYYKYWKPYDTLTKIKSQFVEIQNLKSDDVFIELDCPIFLLEYRRPNYQDVELIKNPILKDYNFQKLKDTFTCFQDIQTYISNILVVNKTMKEVKIEDKYLMQSKGFDNFSFKKEKHNRKK
jgi:hypothetical protein